MAIRSQRTKLTLADIGEPALVKTPNADGSARAEYFLGSLVGIASGFLERQSADKTQKFEGLKGMFRVIPSNPAQEELESGVMFIPEAFHNLIADNLRAAQKDDESASLKFAFEVSSIKAENPAGYSWSFRPLVEPDTRNPLDDFMASIPALTHQKTEQVTDQSGAADVSQPAQARGGRRR